MVGFQQKIILAKSHFFVYKPLILWYNDVVRTHHTIPHYMSLEKSIASGKEHRKQYRGWKAVDYTCRNHGSCLYWKRQRLHSGQKALERTVGQEDEFFGYWFYPDPSDADSDVDLGDDQYEQFGSDDFEVDFNTEH